MEEVEVMKGYEAVGGFEIIKLHDYVIFVPKEWDPALRRWLSEYMFEDWFNPEDIFHGWEGDGCYAIKAEDYWEMSVAFEHAFGCPESTKRGWKDAECPRCADYRVAYEGNDFSTGEGGYPSIPGKFVGTLKLMRYMILRAVYCFPLPGTGGHIESMRIWGHGVDVTATWGGHSTEPHLSKVPVGETVVLLPSAVYNIEIVTRSYPQMHIRKIMRKRTGTIECTSFTDANGNVHDDRIPAFRIF